MKSYCDAMGIKILKSLRAESCADPVGKNLTISSNQINMSNNMPDSLAFKYPVPITKMPNIITCCSTMVGNEQDNSTQDFNSLTHDLEDMDAGISYHTLGRFISEIQCTFQVGKEVRARETIDAMAHTSGRGDRQRNEGIASLPSRACKTTPYNHLRAEPRCGSNHIHEDATHRPSNYSQEDTPSLADRLSDRTHASKHNGTSRDDLPPNHSLLSQISKSQRHHINQKDRKSTAPENNRLSSARHTSMTTRSSSVEIGTDANSLLPLAETSKIISNTKTKSTPAAADNSTMFDNFIHNYDNNEMEGVIVKDSDIMQLTNSPLPSRTASPLEDDSKR